MGTALGDRRLRHVVSIMYCNEERKIAVLFHYGFITHPFNDPSLLVLLLFYRCGPCLLMAPEFESAAKELKDKVRFVKLDTDKEESMAARLNIMGLPTLLFLDKYEPEEGEEVQEEAKAGTCSVRCFCFG